MSDRSLAARFEPGLRYVLPSEEVQVNRRLHWSLIVPSFFAALGGLFLAGFVTGQMSDRRGPLDEIIWLGALVLIGRLIWKVVLWNNDRFIVTTRRIVMVSGVFNRRVAMMPLMRVTDMTYERSLAGRIFGWGTFIIESAGQEQALREIDRLPSPDVLYRAVCALMFGPDAMRPMAPPNPLPESEPEPPAAPVLDVEIDPEHDPY